MFHYSIRINISFEDEDVYERVYEETMHEVVQYGLYFVHFFASFNLQQRKSDDNFVFASNKRLCDNTSLSICEMIELHNGYY